MFVPRPNAIELGVSIAATGDEIHVTIGPKAHRGDIQRVSVQKFLLCRGVAGAFFRESDDVDGSKGPIADEEFFLIFNGEFSFVSKAHSGGRTGPDVENWTFAVGEIFAPFRRAIAPAEFACGSDMANPGGTIPGTSDIEFEIRVEGEKFAVEVDRKVDRVPEAGGDHGPLAAIWRDTRNPAAGCLDGNRVSHLVWYG